MLSIKPSSFYGELSPKTKLSSAPWCDPRIELQHRQTPLLSPSRTWHVFERQDEALSFAKQRGNGLMTFVFHAKSTLTRHFLVAHPREFWLHDIHQPKHDRNSYEIIPEFEPCKLYLDLEFEFAFNPGYDGVKMTNLFIKIISYKLLNLYHLQVDRSLILDLDSTTETKFSRHLIYQIPFISFANNYQVGIFIQEICLLIRNFDDDLCSNLEITKQDLQQLFIKDRHGKVKLFCDEGVYTKNRHFRLYGSTKPNKNSPLTLSPENCYTVHLQDANLQEEAIFLASLITNFEPLDIVVSLPELKSNFKMKSVASCNSSSGQPRNFPSPFPCLDKFIQEEMQKEGARCWIYFPNSQCIVYEGQRTTFCGNVGREHRSNKGMLVVDMRYHHFYRKCHDPDCSGYQSEPQPLPAHVITSLQYPDCSEKDSQEIQELLEFLNAQEDIFDCSISQESQSGSEYSQGSTELSLQLGNLSVTQYHSEIQDTLTFLQSCPEF